MSCGNSIWQLAAEVRLEDGQRGSGLLIGKDMILTSLHVLLGDRPPECVPEGVTAKARVLGELIAAEDQSRPGWDFEKRGSWLRQLDIAWHHAELVWPAAGAPADSEDVALLRVSGVSQEVQDLAQGMRFYAISSPEWREIEFEATGFPTFKMETSGRDEIWNAMRAEGLMDSVPLRGGLNRTLHVSNRSTPDKSDGWRAFSGSGVLALGDSAQSAQVLGVVHKADPKSDGNKELICWPLSGISTDDPFWALSGIERMESTATGPMRAAQKPASAHLADNLVYLDRGRPRRYFRQWLNGEHQTASVYGRCPEKERCRPTLLVLEGHECDLPVQCAQLLASLLGDFARADERDAFVAPKLVSFGNQRDSVKMRTEDLFREWAKIFIDTPLPYDEDIDSLEGRILSGLMQPDKPRILLLEHSDEGLNDDCLAILERVGRLLEKWSPPASAKVSPPIVILCVTTGKEAGSMMDGYLELTHYGEKREELQRHIAALAAKTKADDQGIALVEWYHGIPNLSEDPVSRTDIENWLQDQKAQLPGTFPCEIAPRIKKGLSGLERFAFKFARDIVEVNIV